MVLSRGDFEFKGDSSFSSNVPQSKQIQSRSRVYDASDIRRRHRQTQRQGQAYSFSGNPFVNSEGRPYPVAFLGVGVSKVLSGSGGEN